MNKTIILSQLSETIAALTETTAADAELFVRELSALIAERLETDGQVEVPGLGTFVVSDETVVYAPDSGLAEEINAPFAAFQAIELPDENITDESADQEEIAASAEFEQEALAEEEPEPEPQPAPEPEPEPEPEPVKIPEYRPAKKAEPEPEPAPVPDEPKRPLTWPWWLISCIVCFIAGYICGNSRVADEPVVEPEPEVVEPVQNPEPAEPVVDTIAVPAPRPVVTDTIAPGYFLTGMARRHYGNLDFWPYIYEANASKLGHPDRLSAGTVVVIPPADSLNLDAQNAEQLDVARRKAAEIYSRFNAK